MQIRENQINPILRFLGKPYRYAILFSLLLTSAFVYILLDAFVIPRAIQPVTPGETFVLGPVPLAGEEPGEADAGSPEASQPAPLPAETPIPEILAEESPAPLPAESPPQTDPQITELSYKDAYIEISIETIRAYETDIYLADVKLSSAEYMKSAFAQTTYGRNINEKTSVIADRQNAIFAVNGDCYGFRRSGWVLRNGVLYRSGESDTALLMGVDGSFSCDSDKALIEQFLPDLWQIWSFGPPLVVDGIVSVSENEEITGRSSNSNPRTAIGQAGDLHYIFLVSDGRTSASAGLSLYELATLLAERDCKIAYNLDGGGSSAMVFNGRVLNKPTTDGRRIGEREVSDIVYIGY